MSVNVQLPSRFVAKTSLDEYLEDATNGEFNRVCSEVMESYFSEKGTTDENARKMVVLNIFNDVYLCAANMVAQRYTENWGEHYLNDGGVWYMLPDGTDFSKYTYYKHLPLFMPMLWWMLYFAEEQREGGDFSKISYQVCLRIREKFCNEEEVLAFNRFDVVFGASEEQVIGAIMRIAPSMTTKRWWKGVTDELRLITSYVKKIKRENSHRGGQHEGHILKYLAKDIETYTAVEDLYNSIKKVDSDYPEIRSRFRQEVMAVKGDMLAE